MTQGNYARPYVNQYPTLITYRDVIDRLIDFSNAGPQASQARDYRIALDEAYREVVLRHTWKYYQTQYTIYLNAQFGDGTITYTQNNRTCTLAGATFPSWAGSGHMRIGTTYYEVESLVDSTHLTFSIANNPGADISDATGYLLYQSVYRLPSDYRGNFKWNVPNTLWSSSYISPEDYMRLERRTAAGGNPRMWTIMADPHSQGSFAIFLWPHPSVAASYGGIYQRKPRDLSVSGYDTLDSDFSNVATIANTGTAVTGTSTTFTGRHVGCVMRFGTTTTNPDGTTGLNPYAEQRIIISVTDATHLTLDSAPLLNYTGVKYTISDPLDMSPGMINALLACAKYQYAANKPLEDRPLSALNRNYERAFTIARENDAMILSGRNDPPVYYDRIHDHTYDT